MYEAVSYCSDSVLAYHVEFHSKIDIYAAALNIVWVECSPQSPVQSSCEMMSEDRKDGAFQPPIYPQNTSYFPKFAVRDDLRCCLDREEVRKDVPFAGQPLLRMRRPVNKDEKDSIP